MKDVLGCDVGNAFGYVSVLRDAKEDAMPLLPRRLAEGGGMPTTAYVPPPNGDPIVVYEGGRPAEERYQRDPEHLVRAVKTRLREGTIPLPGMEAGVPAAKIYAAIARTLVALSDEERRLQNLPPVRDIVLTFPAAFSDDPVLDEMQRSVEAEEVNGQKIHVVGRLPEPAAVAIDYLFYMQRLAPEEARITQDHFTVLVYDLGHGTFDTAVVTARSVGKPYELYRKDGLQDVGGKDFDKLIYDYMLHELKEKYGYEPRNEREQERIRKEAVRVKHELSENFTSVGEFQIGNDYQQVELTRAEFERRGKPLIDETLGLVYSVLEDAEDDGISIDCIVLSGGAAQMPMVRNGLQELFGDRYQIALYRPETAVSFGAARYAASLNVKKEGPAPTVQPPAPVVPVLEQLTDCCYGLWMEAEDGRLEGKVRFVVQSGQKRPAVSDPVQIRSDVPRLSVQLYRSRVKNKALTTASRDQCESILFIPFNVTRGKWYQVQITVEEDYRVCVELKDVETGDVQRKSTADPVAKLTQ